MVWSIALRWIENVGPTLVTHIRAFAGCRPYVLSMVGVSVGWRSARTTNAIERLHEEFKRKIKTQTVLPSADTAAMLFWALLASGQINMRKVDGWQTLATTPIAQPIDLAA